MYIYYRTQRELCSQKAERWDMRVNEDKIRGIYFSRRHGPVEAHLTLKRWNNIPFVRDLKYLGVIFDKNYVEVSYSFDRHQGPLNIHQNQPPFEKSVIKHRVKINPRQSID